MIEDDLFEFFLGGITAVLIFNLIIQPLFG